MSIIIIRSMADAIGLTGVTEAVREAACRAALIDELRWAEDKDNMQLAPFVVVMPERPDFQDFDGLNQIEPHYLDTALVFETGVVMATAETRDGYYAHYVCGPWWKQLDHEHDVAGRIARLVRRTLVHELSQRAAGEKTSLLRTCSELSHAASALCEQMGRLYDDEGDEQLARVEAIKVEMGDAARRVSKLVDQLLVAADASAMLLRPQEPQASSS